MKKTILISAWLLILFLPAARAQVLNAEGFENTTFPNTGWTLNAATGVGGGGNLWSRRTTGTNPTANPHDGVDMARFNSRTVPSGATQALITPAFDLSAIGGNTATVSFWMYRDNVSTNLDSLSILINTSASLTGATHVGAVARYSAFNLPDTVVANNWYHYSFPIPSGFNTATNYLLFEGVHNAGVGGFNGSYMYLDSVEWIAYPTLCNAQPAAGYITATPSVICAVSGSSALVLNSATQAAGLTYDWQSGPSLTGPWTSFASIVSTTTGTISATTFYRCIVTCTNAALADTTPVATVTVSASTPPTVGLIPGNAAICIGGAGVELYASGALTYVWTPGTGLSATAGDSVLANPTLNTQYTVTGTDANGCTGTATTNITVHNAPVFTVHANPDTLCAGHTTQLFAAGGGGGGTTFVWNPGGQTGNPVTMTPAATMEYYCTATNAFACTNTDSIQVVVTPAPTDNFSTEVNGNAVTFHDSSSTATSWFWQFGDGNSSTQQNPVYTYSSSGTFLVTLVISTPCGNDTLTREIILYPLSIAAPNGAAAFSIYPNPASGAFSLQFFNRDPESRIQVVNALGEIVYRNEVKVTGRNVTLQVDGTRFATGIYSIQLFSEGNMVSRKLIIH